MEVYDRPQGPLYFFKQFDLSRHQPTFTYKDKFESSSKLSGLCWVLSTIFILVLFAFGLWQVFIVYDIKSTTSIDIRPDPGLLTTRAPVFAIGIQ